MEVTQEIQDIASDLGPSAVGVLTETEYSSFCLGSDELEAKGLIDRDGQLSEIGLAVRDYLLMHMRAGS